MRRRKKTLSRKRGRESRPRQPPAGGGSIPENQGREKWVEPPRPLALQTHRGPALQVGAIYRSHDSDRDSSRTVDIGPGV